MSGGPRHAAGLRALLDQPICVVDREPERPRGRLAMPPSVARAVVFGAGGMVLLAVIVIMASFEHSWFRSRGAGWVLLGLFGTAAAGGVLAAAQRTSAVSGQPRSAWRLAIIGLVAVAGWSVLVASVVSWWWQDDETATLVAGGAGVATVLWVVGTIAIVQLGRPVISVGLRRFRRIAVGVLASAGVVLIATIVMAVPFEILGVEPSGSATLVLGIMSMLGGWGTVIGLALCGSATGTAARMERTRSRTSETVDPDARLRCACPGCGDVADRPRGRQRCVICGTRVRVWIQEPRCRCGYAIFRLAGDRCPECGQEVPDADRFSVRRFEADDPHDPGGADDPDGHRSAAGDDAGPGPGPGPAPHSGDPARAQPRPGSSAVPAASPAETESSTSDAPPSA